MLSLASMGVFVFGYYICTCTCNNLSLSLPLPLPLLLLSAIQGEIWMGAETQKELKEWGQVLRDAGKVYVIEL